MVVAGKAATCTEKGLTDGKKCSVCGTVTVAQKEIAKKAHTEVVVAGKAATCTEKGLTDGKKCSVCGAVTVAQKEIAKKAHTEVVVAGKAATCTEKGLTDGKKCSACGAVTVAQKEIAAKGHTDGKWVTVKAATREEEGLKELHCADCNAVLKSETIPVVTVVYYWDNTACSMGLTFRDLTDLTDEWYQFTPVDLSIEGTQTFYLAASNMYVIGEVIVTVEEGNVTVECEYFSDDIKVKSEFCTFLPSLAETVTVNQEELTNYAFGEPISIEEALAGDTKVLLYICNVVDYNTDMPVVRFYADDTAVKKAIAAMQLVMD